jgi:hypothetical protein
MRALVGFALGYAIGARMGSEGYEELRRAWQAIAESEELKGAVASARAFVENAVSQGGDAIAGRLRELGGANGDLVDRLRGIVDVGDVRAAWRRISDSTDVQSLVSAGSALLEGALARSRGRSGHLAGRA